MAKPTHLPIFLCLILLILSIGNVEAIEDEDTLDLNSFPKLLAEAFNISEFAGGILASIFLMLTFILPVAIYAQKNILPSIIMGLLVLSFCIAIGYLPLFLLVLVVLIIASLWGAKAKGWFT